MSVLDGVSTAFESHFGGPPHVFARAPGRVNIMGAHTDYNAGFVLPFAIQQSVQMAVGPADGGEITAYSLALKQSAAFPTTVDERCRRGAWQNYLRGVCRGLRDKGVAVGGAELVIGGDLPIGGGVSSSAALCVAAALALLKLTGTSLPPLEIAKLARQAEHDFAGTPCGIMDPYVSLFAKEGHALLLECESNTHQDVSLEFCDVRFVLIDSGVGHELSSGVYEQRVRECQAAVDVLRQREPSVRTLRDVTPRLLEVHGQALDIHLRNRTRHVVTENIRVRLAHEALVDGRVRDVGKLLCESHRSLRDDYEISCPEADELVDVLETTDGVFGARLVGGGGGGMVLALVDRDALAGLPRELGSRLGSAGQTPRLLALSAADGAECRAC